MKFSEALEQYLEARERPAHVRHEAALDMREAAEVMDRLAPGDAP
jgi:hypothetical protein